MSMRVCAQPGCPELVSEGSRCETHRIERRRASDKARNATRSNYGHRRWRRVRSHYLKKHPLCECGCGRLAQIVHHLDGKGLDGPRAYDPTNLQALTKPCHDRITAQQQPGGWHNAPAQAR